MDRETARQEIRRRVSCTEYLEKSKSGLYCCPFCGSGKGNHGTGALKLYKTNTWTCHACNKSGDVIDLYMQTTGADYNTALSLLAQEIGVTIDPYRPDAAADFAPAASGKPQSDFKGQGGINTPAADKTPPEGAETQQGDYTEYYRECRKRINDPAAVAYLQRRGISVETAAAYWIGYDPAADPASAPGAMGNTYKPHPCPRLIIPTSKAHYVGRSIDPATPKEFEKMNPSKEKGAGAPGIFNVNALYEQDVQEIFVVEGAFDALSILEAGYTAISLNSAGNYDALLKQLEKRRTAATLILCPDNDKDPDKVKKIKKQFGNLAAGLQRLNLSHITANINGSYKDANEALTGDKEAFADALERAQRQTAARPDNTKYYIDSLMSGEIERFKNERKTGFKNLDAQAGGLYTGLYVLAAISSLGKTSFALQLADQLAEDQIDEKTGKTIQGNDVIYFSLEQSRLELVSKSIARRTVRKDDRGKLYFDKAVTSIEIRKGYIPRSVQDTMKEYKEAVSDRVSIVEGNFACNVSFIGDYVRQYIRKTGKRPVVFVDYLQILQPAEEVRRQSTKEIIDYTVTELKRLSRELDLTIIVVSSVNRANYLTPIDFESLKESGSIEYSCDVLWGLQLQCLKDPGFEKLDIKKQREQVKKAKTETPRKIELSCLKNRYGIASYSCYFKYYPANDLFEGCPDSEIDFPEETPKAGRRPPKA